MSNNNSNVQQETDIIIKVGDENNLPIEINLTDINTLLQNSNEGGYSFELENLNNLPNFTVITGLNGSGKSKFLNNINNNEKANSEYNIYYAKHIFSLEPSTLLETKLQRILSVINASGTNDYNIVGSLASNGVRVGESRANLISQQFDKFRQDYIKKNPSVKKFNTNSFLSLFGSLFSESLDHLLTTNVENIKGYDINKNNSESDEKNYVQFLTTKGNKNTYVLHDFIEFVNDEIESLDKIFKDDSLKNLFNKDQYYFSLQTNTSNLGRDIGRDIGTLLTIIRKYNKYTKNLEELSDGEKNIFIMFFYLHMWKKDFEKLNANKNTFSNIILLLDEPDATLHPSVAKLFIQILQNIYCTKYNIKIIMVTHNLASISCVKNNSLFVMTKKQENEKTTFVLSQANKISTLNIVAEPVVKDLLTIFNNVDKNKFNILVEGKHDKDIFEHALNILSKNNNDYKTLQDNINFIDGGGTPKISAVLNNLPDDFKDLLPLAILDNDQAGVKAKNESIECILLPIPEDDDKKFKEIANKYNATKNKTLKDLKVTCVEFLFRDILINKINNLESDLQEKFCFGTREAGNLLGETTVGNKFTIFNDKDFIEQFNYKIPAADDSKISNFKNEFSKEILKLTDENDFNNVKPLFKLIIENQKYKDYLDKIQGSVN